MARSLETVRETLLVVRSQTGDENAFRELVERYTPRLRYFLQKLAPESMLVDDMLQDVWLNVFRSITRLKNVITFPAWIYRIARMRVAVEFRRRHLELQTVDDYPMEAIPDSRLISDFLLVDAERIHLALDRLPAAQREVLILRFLEDMSYEDIASIVESPVGTVRSRLFHAKCGLRRILES